MDEVTAATAQLQFAKDFSLLGFAPEPLALVPRHRLVAVGGKGLWGGRGL